MVQPDLPSRSVTLRHLASFFLMGLGLFGLKRAWHEEPASPQLVVSVPQSAGQQEVERAIDEAVLVDQGLAHGGALIDPVVREQMLRNMRVASGRASEPDERLLDRALALGVHRADPLIRKRLAFQAEQLVRGRVRVEAPSSKQLQEYLEAHRARYQQPARTSFAQIFVSRSKHARDLDSVSEQLAARLAQETPGEESAHRYSEPSLLPQRISRASAPEIAARFGDGFARELEGALEGRWVGPLSSSYGHHFVWISRREAPRMPRVDELRARLILDRETDLKTLAVAREVRALREGYRIEVRRSGR
jgi:hypothetical protein